MVELGGHLELVAETLLELVVAGVAGLQNLQGDGAPVLRVPAGEDPGEPPLADEVAQGVAADAAADQVFRISCHGWTLQPSEGRLN